LIATPGPPSPTAELAELGEGLLRNWAGDVVGSTRVCVELQRT
jgi:hypothetical protein